MGENLSERTSLNLTGKKGNVERRRRWHNPSEKVGWVSRFPSLILPMKCLCLRCFLWVTARPCGETFLPSKVLGEKMKTEKEINEKIDEIATSEDIKTSAYTKGWFEALNWVLDLT